MTQVFHRIFSSALETASALLLATATGIATALMRQESHLSTIVSPSMSTVTLEVPTSATATMSVLVPVLAAPMAAARVRKSVAICIKTSVPPQSKMMVILSAYGISSAPVDALATPLSKAMVFALVHQCALTSLTDQDTD